MALFRLVNRNVHLNVWFSTVAGKPHPCVPVWERGEQFRRIERPAPLTNDASGLITLPLGPGDFDPVAPLRDIDGAAVLGFSPALRFNDGTRRAWLLNQPVRTGGLAPCGRRNRPVQAQCCRRPLGGQEGAPESVAASIIQANQLVFITVPLLLVLT